MGEPKSVSRQNDGVKSSYWEEKNSHLRGVGKKKGEEER